MWVQGSICYSIWGGLFFARQSNNIAFVLFLFFFFGYRGCGKGKWYKFNDTVVEEFELTDETLEYECFGGEYRPKVYDQCKQKWRWIYSSFIFLISSQ